MARFADDVVVDDDVMPWWRVQGRADAHGGGSMVDSCSSALDMLVLLRICETFIQCN